MKNKKILFIILGVIILIAIVLLIIFSTRKVYVKNIINRESTRKSSIVNKDDYKDIYSINRNIGEVYLYKKDVYYTKDTKGNLYFVRGAKNLNIFVIKQTDGFTNDKPILEQVKEYIEWFEENTVKELEIKSIYSEKRIDNSTDITKPIEECIFDDNKVYTINYYGEKMYTINIYLRDGYLVSEIVRSL